MISINLAPDQVTDFLSKAQNEAFGTKDAVGIACINSPLNVTLSGPDAGIDAVELQAGREGIFARKLKTGVAYHSKSMCSVAEEYLTLMGTTLSPNETPMSSIPMMSTVTGKRIDTVALASGQYWVDNMVSPVQFASGIRLVADLGVTDFVEVGPHPALRRYVQDTLGSGIKTQYMAALHRGHSATEKTLELAGTLFSRGHPISLTAVNNIELGGETKSRFLVDCPPYPFDHSHKFWAESRISRDYRLRTPTRGEFLGQRVSDWNPLQPRWRSFLSVETSSWIGHHVVGDTVLYPAAGMLIMALEAAREMAPDHRTITAYFVREARFLSPIVVPEAWEDRVETMLCLTPVQRHTAWFDIAIFAYDKGSHSWTQVFQASVETQYAQDTDFAIVHEAVRAQHREALETCVLPVDAQLLYSNAAEQGLQYGDWFRLCQDVQWDKTRAQAIASVRSDNTRFRTASLVHPAVLDTVFHVLRVSAGQQHAANVPVRMEKAWFAASGWQTPATGSVRWLVTSDKKGAQAAGAGEQGSVSALADDNTVLARIGRLKTAAVSKDEDAQAGKKKLLYGLDWRPQLSLLSPAQVSGACEADKFPRDEAVMRDEHQRRTAVLNIVAVRHVKNMPEEQRVNLNSTLRHHLDWLEHYIASLSPAERDAASALTDTEFESELDSFAAAFPSWTLYPHVARSLPGIVAGEVDPLQVIFDSDHAKTFYASLFHTVCGDGRLDKFMELAAHETPSLRILEVGAGTGGMTVHILNALKQREERNGAMAFSEYMYTDISPVFFESAKARWEAEGFGGRVAFKTLDMEHSVLEQGFAENSYDLLVAGSCVHATGLLSKTLQNLRRALRPGGRLVLLEVTDPTDIATCFFATLASGWWLSQEEWRLKNKSPLASEDTWDQVLRDNGFSGNDLVLRDTRDAEAHIVSVIVSTALDAEETTAATNEGKEDGRRATVGPRRAFVVDPQQSHQKEVAAVLCNGQDVVLSLDDIHSSSISSDDIVVSLIEVGNPILASIAEAQFSQLQTLIKQTNNLIWVTAPQDGNGNGNGEFQSKYAIARGFLRTLRSETPHARIISLAIEDLSSTNAWAEWISRTVNVAFKTSPAPDLEYVVRSGLIHTARAVEDVTGNTTLNSLLFPSVQELAWKDGPAVKLALGTPGSLGSLRFEQEGARNSNSSEIGPGEIEIEARAWGLTRRDVLTASGRLENIVDSDGFGADCAGVVTRIGPNCDAQGPRPGDSVVMLARGCMRKFPRAHESHVLRMNSIISYEQATAALEPAMTTYHALLDVARITEGDTVLVHEAASAAGQMAVQIAKMKGANVFVTLSASSDPEQDRLFLVDTLGVASDHIFSPASFADGVRHATQGRGVDIVLSTLTGDTRLASLQLLASSGRFVEIGPGESDGLSDLSLAGPLARNTSFATVDILDLRPQLTAKLLKETMSLLGEGSIVPPNPARVFPATGIANAFRALQDGEVTGRIVITPRPEDVVPQLLVVDQDGQKPGRFDNDASYLVPGGLGGVGRSILVWMASRGAKNLIVPSRSGASSAAASQLVSSLRSQGVSIIVPKCNVAKEAELAALLDDVNQTMPEVRGVINCAMVLDNAIFVNMTFQQWSTAIEAKVTGSLNLHRLLPRQGQAGLDFFVHLASLAGVNGQMASANYAAGCTFQDALARYYPGTTVLDVGWMADVGLIAETAAYQRQLRDWGNMQMVEERELLEVLGMVCNGQKHNAAKTTASQKQQLLVGLLTPADYLAKGKEVPPGLLGRPLLSAFSQSISQNRNGNTSSLSSAEATAAAVDHGALFRAAPDDATRAQIVSAGFAEKLARAMMMPADDVDPDRPLSAYGVDSLMAVELRNWVLREFGAVLGMWEMMSGDKVIKGIAEAVTQKSSMSKK